MGVQNPTSTTLNLHKYSGRYRSGIVLPTTRNDFGIIQPFQSTRALRAFYPLPNQTTLGVRHAYNTTYPGAKYRSLVQATGGSPPYLYEIVRAPAGMSIGEFLVPDANGDLVADSSYGVLTHDSMPAGSYSIAIRCTDQAGAYVTFEWVLDSDLSLNFFTAPTNLGAGTGLSEANAKAFVGGVYLGATTDSPAKGKVLRFLGGNYTGMAVDTVISSAYHPSSWCAIYGQTPIFSTQLNLTTSDISLCGLKFFEASTGAFGIVDITGEIHRGLIWECVFEDCFNTQPPTDHFNQACIGAQKVNAGRNGRNNVAIINCIFKNNIRLHGFDFYNINSLVFERNINIITNPAIVDNTSSWIFPKSTCYDVQIAYNTYNNPNVDGGSDGVVQIHNAADVYSWAEWKLDIFYNTFCAIHNLNLFISNGSDNNLVPEDTPTVTITNRISRNSMSGRIAAGNTDREVFVEKQSFFDGNAFQTSTVGSIIVLGGSPANTSPAWWSNTGTECQAASGVFDANMKLTPAYSAYVGTRGAQLRRVT